MISIYRFIFGYVRIFISGENPERLINYFIAKGISVWGFKRRSNGIWCNISVRDFLKIRDAKHKVAGVKIRLKSKYGLPFMFKRIIKRFGIVVGIVIFISLNIFFSQFIWSVDVVGGDTHEKSKIISLCADEGVEIGKLSGRIDTYVVTQRLMLKLDNVAWMSINIEGSALTVNISKAETTEKDSGGEQGDLIASHSGVIKLCKVTAGKTVVSNGQAVSKGDVLVLGEFLNGDDLMKVKSSGEILAETERSFNVYVDKEFLLQRRCKTETKTVLRLFWFEIPLYLTNAQGTPERFWYENCSFFGSETPIGIYKREYALYEKKVICITDSDAKNIALSKVADTVRMYPIQSVEQVNIIVSEDEDGYNVTVKTECIEDIAEFSTN